MKVLSLSIIVFPQCSMSLMVWVISFCHAFRKRNKYAFNEICFLQIELNIYIYIYIKLGWSHTNIIYYISSKNIIYYIYHPVILYITQTRFWAFDVDWKLGVVVDIFMITYMHTRVCVYISPTFADSWNFILLGKTTYKRGILKQVRNSLCNQIK